jgi:hypothetical protein
VAETMGELQEAGRVQALCYSIIGYLGCSLACDKNKWMCE